MAKGNKKVLTHKDMGSLSGVIVRDVKNQPCKDVIEEELTADFIKVNPIKEDYGTLKLQISAEMTDDFKKLLDKIDTVVLLNEQLTAENISLLQKIDVLNEEVTNQKLAYELLNDVTVSNAGKFLSVSSELSKIKSKWWYKLFKNI